MDILNENDYLIKDISNIVDEYLVGTPKQNNLLVIRDIEILGRVLEAYKVAKYNEIVDGEPEFTMTYGGEVCYDFNDDSGIGEMIRHHKLTLKRYRISEYEICAIDSDQLLESVKFIYEYSPFINDKGEIYPEIELYDKDWRKHIIYENGIAVDIIDSKYIDHCKHCRKFVDEDSDYDIRFECGTCFKIVCETCWEQIDSICNGVVGAYLDVCGECKTKELSICNK